MESWTAMDSFCGSPFWNTTLTWYSDNPDFTKCFEKTALVLIPIAFFWVFLLFEWFWLKNSLNRDVPWNWKNVSKLLLVAAICAICIGDFCINLDPEAPLIKANIYMPLLKLITFAAAGVLIYYNKKYGMQTSGHQFLFWTLELVCGIPQFRTEILEAQDGRIENEYLHKSYMAYYPLVVAIVFVTTFSDERPRRDPYEKGEKRSPITGTSFLGRLVYVFYDPLLLTGFKRPLEFKDMWNLEYESQSKRIVPLFENELKRRMAKNREDFIKQQKYGVSKAKKPKTVSIIPIMFWCFYPRFVMGLLCRTVTDLIVFVNPQILSLLIAFVASNDPIWKGLLYAFGMFIAGTVQTLINSMHFVNLYYFGLCTRTALMSCIYRKSLRISNNARKNKTVGEIVNLMAADAERFMEFSLQLPVLWSCPILLTLAIYFLWQEVGIAILAGLGVLIALFPLNLFIMRFTKRLQVKQMKDKDERVKMMNEILNGIKVLKLYAWEGSFERLVEQIRLRELGTMLKAAYLGAANNFIWNCAPFIVAFATFGTYVLLDENNVLDASKAFVSLALINILRGPMNMIPNVVNTLVQTSVSIKRINSFLNSEEVESYVENDPDENDALVIEKGNFSWGEAPVLQDINIKVPKRSITTVVGPVGCGKTSLINAFLSEMEKISGKVKCNGTVAYVSQLAWIQNATVRENIIFGKPYDKQRYNRVLEACALQSDLKILADGDKTEIGEKGINLSGGQKQRISLARAIYEEADIYLLDDPLSAVDAHVGKHIFDNVIGPNGLLAGKVRVLVTHAVTFLPKTDQIIVLKDGKIQEIGTYRELLSRKGAFAEYLIHHIGEEVNDEAELQELEEQIEETPLFEEIKRKISRRRSRISESSSNLEDGITRSLSVVSLRSNGKKKSLIESQLSIQDENRKKRHGKLIEAEHAEHGNIKVAVFKYYFAAVGFAVFLGTIIFYVGFQGFGIGSNIWLGMWTEDPNVIGDDGKINTALRNKYLIVYAVLGIMQGVCIYVAHVWYSKGTNRAAAILHNSLMTTVMRLPMAFFDVTPTGRILARFSSDVIGIDMRLPGQINGFFMNSIKVLGTLFVICYATPWFTVVVIPISILYIFIQRYFVATTRQVKRLESVSRSPIYTQFSETISGTVVIRAYRCQERFVSEAEKKVDDNQKCVYPSCFSNRWLGVRLETIGNIIILSSALFAIFNKNLNAATVGLSVSYALQITQTLNMLVRTICDAETSVVSVERIKEYSEKPREKPWEIPEKKPKRTWPNEGNVEFSDYSVRYRPELDLVLKGVNFTVKGGEKVGIVGRTGAGKSSLTLSLFRIIEASAGKILIDGVDISEIGLYDLRSKLTIIPQDAVLFSGTLRLNLDPFEEHSDQDVWKCLELAHLKGFVSTLPAGLAHHVSEGGSNLSSGQRQLICLARALLRKTKVLILDEATAAVDLETDDLIQATIRKEFSDCTVITIAHRLNTIMDSNRVLVLANGQIAEYDTPAKLLENEQSIFYSMCNDAGLTSK